MQGILNIGKFLILSDILSGISGRNKSYRIPIIVNIERIFTNFVFSFLLGHHLTESEVKSGIAIAGDKDTTAAADSKKWIVKTTDWQYHLAGVKRFNCTSIIELASMARTKKAIGKEQTQENITSYQENQALTLDTYSLDMVLIDAWFSLFD